jgi:serine/threonine protein kinase
MSQTSDSPVHIPDHTLVRMIGRGAYGEVWLAKNVMGMWRAVKIVRRASFTSERPYEREFEGIRRFEPVSRAHDTQVDILHVGRDDSAELFYYVMELGDDVHSGQEIVPATYIPRTLESELKEKQRLPARQCIQIGLALATALEHLHAHGLIHRDIKPSNIIFVHGRPKLADIGLVATAEEAVSFVGTEGYVPVEGPGSSRADIFSLGRVLYEITTGFSQRRFPEIPTSFGLDETDAKWPAS